MPMQFNVAFDGADVRASPLRFSRVATHSCEIKRVGERSAESREFPFPQGKLTEWVKIRINKVKAKIIDKINNSSNDRQPPWVGCAKADQLNPRLT